MRVDGNEMGDAPILAAANWKIDAGGGNDIDGMRDARMLVIMQKASRAGHQTHLTSQVRYAEGSATEHP